MIIDSLSEISSQSHIKNYSVVPSQVSVNYASNELTPEIDFGSPAVRMSDIKEVNDKSFFSKGSDLGIMDSPNFEIKEAVEKVVGEPPEVLCETRIKP